MANSDESRRKAWETFNNRLEVNVPILTDIVNARRQITKLLGVENWAAYIIQDKMAKTVKSVDDVSFNPPTPHF